MWPVSLQEKQADPSLKNRVSLQEIKESIGAANFNSEYLGNPGSGEDTYFPQPDPLTHGWSFDSVDDKLENDPVNSHSQIVWHRKGERISQPLSQFIRERRLFITADTSYSQNSSSDYKVSCCMAIDLKTNELFVMDLWSAQCSEQKLVLEILKMADRWKVPSIHPELVRESISLYEALLSMVQTRATQELGFSHTPSIQKI